MTSSRPWTLCALLLGSAPLRAHAAAPDREARAAVVGRETRSVAVIEGQPMDPALQDKLAVCSDGKGHYVAVTLDYHVHPGVYYGDAKRLYAVEKDLTSSTIDHDYYDPRFFHSQMNPNLRGYDLRFFSNVRFAPEKKVCQVRCGERAASLTILSDIEQKAYFAGVRLVAGPQRWVPHRLARDEQGIYYYIDRGVHERDKEFRLFVGPRGNMKRVKLTNTVSDSEGDIFATRTGSLRLVVGRSEGTWIEGKRRQPLTVVPTDREPEAWRNRMMIFQDLGVYAGEPQGTPCDLPLPLATIDSDIR